MGFSISIKNIDNTFKELFNSSETIIKKNDQNTVSKLVQELKEETPIDTGNARNSWIVENTKQGFDIKNTAEYIEYLNQGSSQQAPEYFIERTALKYGTPKGAITEII